MKNCFYLMKLKIARMDRLSRKDGGVEAIAKTDSAHVNDSFTFLGHRIIITLRCCGDMCVAERLGAGFQFY